MKAEDWRRLGQALINNADLLQELSNAEDYWLPMPTNTNKDLAWLFSKGLIDTEEDTLHISGMLVDLGAQISLQGFERAAPDLEEALIAVQQQSQGYLESKRANAMDDADRHRRRLGHTIRQIILHLRDDYLSTRNFIEGNLGYSVSPAERLRDIQSAIERIKRLHQKLTVFSYDALRQVTLGDRELTRMLTGLQSNSLHAAIDMRRSDFTTLLGRLDTLSLSVRKRNKFRLLSQALDNFLLAGNTLDVHAMMADPDNTTLFPSPHLAPTASVPTPEKAGERINSFEALMVSLPEPKVKLTAPEEVAVSSEKEAIAFAAQSKRPIEIPFARPHLFAMLAMLKDTGQPQSATAYWIRHGDKQVEIRHWLYALSGYYQRLANQRGGEHMMKYRLVLKHRPHRHHEGNRQVFDLMVARQSAHSRSPRNGIT